MLRRSARLLAPACALALCACAGTIAQSPEVLCGTWRSDDGTTQRWWIYGDDLLGVTLHVDASGKVVSTERLALLTSGDEHLYVSQSAETPAIAFQPTEPSATHSEIVVPASGQVWAWTNYENDFPQEVHYVLVDGRLETRLSASGEDGGWLMGWWFERVGECGEEPEPTP